MSTFVRQRNAEYAEYGGKCVHCHLPVEPHKGYISDIRNDRGKYDCVHKGDCYLAVVGGTPPKDPPPTFADTSAAAVEPSLSELEKVAQELLQKTADRFLEVVPSLVAQEVLRVTPRELHIKVGTVPKVTMKHHHKALPDILTMVVAGSAPFLVGPAGSGKTTLGQNVADALKRKFYFASAVTRDHKLLGYMDANGKYVRTSFREAFEKGGVFLLDEMDASSPTVMTTFNAAFANRYCDFPDKIVYAHKDFVAIGAGNTYGRGADRQYVGRNQQDAATLDRFQPYEVDYDEELELALAGNADWTFYVQKVRKAIDEEKVRHIVSPRASIVGARLLAAGMEQAKVEEACVWKGLDKAQRDRIVAWMGVL